MQRGGETISRVHRAAKIINKYLMNLSKCSLQISVQGFHFFVRGRWGGGGGGGGRRYTPIYIWMDPTLVCVCVCLSISVVINLFYLV